MFVWLFVACAGAQAPEVRPAPAAPPEAPARVEPAPVPPAAPQTIPPPGEGKAPPPGTPTGPAPVVLSPASKEAVGRPHPGPLAELVSVTEVGADVVLTFDRRVPGWTIGWADTAEQCGSGAPIAAGKAGFLKVQLTEAVAHGAQTLPREIPLGKGALGLVSVGCDFESAVELDVKVRQRVPLSAVEQENPPRLVISVGK